MTRPILKTHACVAMALAASMMLFSAAAYAGGNRSQNISNVRDHRTGSSQGGVTVRDHRSSASKPVVRDHRKPIVCVSGLFSTSCP